MTAKHKTTDFSSSFSCGTSKRSGSRNGMHLRDKGSEGIPRPLHLQAMEEAQTSLVL